MEEKEIEEKIPQQKEESAVEPKEAKEPTKAEAKPKEIENEANKEQTKPQEVQPPQQKEPKDDIKKRLEEIKQKSKSVYEEYKKYANDLKASLFNLSKQEDNILKTTVNELLGYFKKLKMEGLEDIKTSIKNIEYDNKEQEKELEIKEPSSGRAKGIILGLLTAIAILIGVIGYGVQVANLELTMSTFSSKSTYDTIAAYYLKLLNINQPPIVGYILIGLVALVFGFLVYKITTYLKRIKNMRYVKELEKNTFEYENKLKNKIVKIKELLDHLEKVKSVTQKYDIILQEQNGKIKRMLFIEQPESFEDLHHVSKVEVEKTLLILDEFVKLMDTPVNKGEELNPDSITRLKSANIVINEVIKKIYES